VSNKTNKKRTTKKEVSAPVTKTKAASSTTALKVEEAIVDKLSRHFGASFDEATKDQVYKATAITVKDILLAKKREFKQANNKSGGKRVYYLCMEFLVGRSLKNNLYNLGLTNVYKKILAKHGYDTNPFQSKRHCPRSSRENRKPSDRGKLLQCWNYHLLHRRP